MYAQDNILCQFGLIICHSPTYSFLNQFSSIFGGNCIKTKPNPTLGKPTPAPQQVHQHSQDDPTGESKHQTPPESLTALNNFKKGTKRDDSALPQFLTHHKCDDLDPTETPSAVPTALQAPSDDTSNPKRTHSLMETQCNHSQYPILMKKICTHDPSTNQVSKYYNPNPVTFPYPPDPGEHVLETFCAPTHSGREGQTLSFQSNSTKRGDGKFFQLDMSFQESHFKHFMFW